jgi:DNA-binding IclR family transcriptional regulator
MTKSTVHRHLATLVDLGFLTKSGAEYTIGLKFLDYGIHAQQQDEIYQQCRDHARELADETGETVWLFSKDREYAVPVYRADGGSPYQSFIDLGTHHPLNQPAAGKAILAHLPRDETERILAAQGLPKSTEHTITDREALLTELERVRERGYAVNEEEAFIGLNAVGVAIVPDREPIGAISVAGVASRLTEEKMDDYVAPLSKTAEEIELQFRYGTDGT